MASAGGVVRGGGAEWSEKGIRKTRKADERATREAMDVARQRGEVEFNCTVMLESMRNDVVETSCGEVRIALYDCLVGVALFPL